MLKKTHSPFFYLKRKELRKENKQDNSWEAGMIYCKQFKPQSAIEAHLDMILNGMKTAIQWIMRGSSGA